MYDKETKERTSAQREQVVELLKLMGDEGVLNTDLQEISLNHTARISELRKLGYKINAVDLGRGIYRYTLVSIPATETKQQRAIDMFWDALNNEYNNQITKEGLEKLFREYGLNVVRKWGANHS